MGAFRDELENGKSVSNLEKEKSLALIEECRKILSQEEVSQRGAVLTHDKIQKLITKYSHKAP